MGVKSPLKTITGSPQPEAAKEQVYTSSHNRGDNNLNFNADPRGEYRGHGWIDYFHQ